MYDYILSADLSTNSKWQRREGQRPLRYVPDQVDAINVAKWRSRVRRSRHGDEQSNPDFAEYLIDVDLVRRMMSLDQG